MSDSDKLTFFHLLGFCTAALAITAAVLSFYSTWYTGLIAVVACIVYEVRIWLIRSVMKGESNT